jgi:hypothetical protein
VAAHGQKRGAVILTRNRPHRHPPSHGRFQLRLMHSFRELNGCIN